MTDPLTILYEHISASSAMDYEYDADGNKVWLNADGHRHRVDGPAFVEDSGTYQSWWIDGERHREDGPAVEYLDGGRADTYWLDNTKMKKEDWLKDPRVQRVLALKKLENKNIKDDDFLRTFGSVL